MVIRSTIRVLTGAVICAVVVGGCSTGVDQWLGRFLAT